MTTPAGAIPLGAKRLSGGHWQATWSIKPGVRVHVLVPVDAYQAGALARLGEHVVDKLGRPHGLPITPSGS